MSAFQRGNLGYSTVVQYIVAASQATPAEARADCSTVVAASQGLILAHRHRRNHVPNEALLAHDLGRSEKNMVVW